jgi:hypothetical protein
VSNITIRTLRVSHAIYDARCQERVKMPSARYIELRSQLTVVIVCALLLAAAIYQCLSIE